MADFDESEGVGGWDGLSDGGPRRKSGLSTVDYVIVAAYVVIVVVIGSRVSSSTGSAKNYFLAGKGANRWVAGISLISGITSGISFIGVPGYTYKNGVAMLSFLCGFILAAPFIIYLAIPFFARPELKFTTSYSYLEARFSRRIRSIGSALFLLRVIVYMGFVLFAPAVALEAVAGVPVYASVLVTGTLATAYTCKGGMEAVIWTDFLASLTLIAGVSVALAMALTRVEGGAGNLWRTSAKEGWLIPNDFFSNSPLKTVNFWCMFFGFAFNMAAQSGTDQIAVQRYLATADVRSAQVTAAGGLVGNMIMTVLLVILGWALHGFYQTRQNEVPCDVKHDTDKIFAFYFANDLPPGICGLLVAALCATTMSVFAGGINAATTCFIIDFVQNHRLLTANHGAVVNTVKLAKILTVCFGLLSIVIAILAQYINESLSLITSVAQAVCCAPTFGVFLLGMLSQRADSFDAAVGLGVCFAFMVYLLAGAAICTDSLPTQSCSKNDTAPDYSLVTAQPLHKLPSSCHGTLLVARVSQWLYPAVGSAVCFFSGLISMLIRRQSPPVTKIMGLTWWTREMGPLAEARLGANQHNYTDYDAAEVDPFLQTAYSKPIN